MKLPYVFRYRAHPYQVHRLSFKKRIPPYAKNYSMIYNQTL